MWKISYLYQKVHTKPLFWPYAALLKGQFFYVLVQASIRSLIKLVLRIQHKKLIICNKLFNFFVTFYCPIIIVPIILYTEYEGHQESGVGSGRVF